MMNKIIAPLLFVLLLLAGCANTLQHQATALQVTGAIADTACEEVRVAREIAQDEAVENAPTRDTAQAAVDMVRGRFAPALASCELIASAHDVWFEAVSLAALGAPFTLADGLRLAAGVLSLWPSLTTILESVGVHVPALPSELQLSE